MNSFSTRYILGWVSEEIFLFTVCDLQMSLSLVRSWGRPGRKCRVRMTVSWWTMRMSKYLQQEPDGSDYISLGSKHPGCADFQCTPDCFSLIHLLWGSLESEVTQLIVLDTSQVDHILWAETLFWCCLTSLYCPQWLVGLAGSSSLCCVSVLWSSVRDDGPDLHTPEGTATNCHFRGIYLCDWDNSFVIQYCWERLKSYWGK